MIEQRIRCGIRIVPAGTDRNETLIRSDDLAVTGDDQQLVFICNDHQRFQAAHPLIRSPHLSQVHSGSFQIASVFFQFLLEFFRQ